MNDSEHPGSGEPSGTVTRRSVLGTAGLTAAGLGVSGGLPAHAAATVKPSAAQTKPSRHVIKANTLALDELPFSDRADFEDADRGFIAALEPGVVRDETGRVVWDNDSYDFLQGSSPSSVHPSLWRQSQLTAKQGLYEIAPGFYQIRGLDLSHMTLVEGDSGVIVIDPLITKEVAAAGLALYREHRGDRLVTGLIYTHSHVDHFGGALGVTTTEEVAAGRCSVLAPEGFLEHAVAENIYAGTAMGRRATYMFGVAITRSPMGQVGSGLGQTTSRGTVTLIAPTLDITHTGQVETIDGVRIEFQVTPGTEAPAEMNFHFPDQRVLCMAENATHTMHNLLTLRGALVRDPHAWAKYLNESILLYADKSDVVFSSHHWPTWGTERIVEYMTTQRDVYAYLHDQTLRLLNQGYVGTEIAEMMELPPGLADTWATRGYYGSVSHNVKAIYQRYMGWFDGNPAHLWEHTPVEGATRHLAAMGGAHAVLAKAKKAYNEGDYRWAAQLVNYVLFTDPEHKTAKNLQASAFEQLAYGAENATWRNFYLSGAHELRHGSFGTPPRGNNQALLAALTVEQVFDVISLRIKGLEASKAKGVIDWRFPDVGGHMHRSELSNGVLVHYHHPDGTELPAPDAAVTLTRGTLLRTMPGGGDIDAAIRNGDIKVEGDESLLKKLQSLLDAPDPGFAIVTP
jgi:alkyl sulfatase BDS1-like metallo-beta-lactamase superfamily hydrolase